MQDLVVSWMQNSLFKSALHYELKNEMEMPEVDWVAPDEFPDLRNCDYIAVDLETSDPNLLTKVTLMIVTGKLIWSNPINFGHFHFIL